MCSSQCQHCVCDGIKSGIVSAIATINQFYLVTCRGDYELSLKERICRARGLDGIRDPYPEPWDKCPLSTMGLGIIRLDDHRFFCHPSCRHDEIGRASCRERVCQYV